MNILAGCGIAGLAVMASAIPAFPGAEGAGAQAVGGRGGDVYTVTTLADSGAGSLREGIHSAGGPRTILFNVSGNIELMSGLTVNRPKITIAGQSAPGDGICLQNFALNISADDVVVRHLRSRLGTNLLAEQDAIWINAGRRIILDHCSTSWSVDETLSATANAADVTVQWCFITESLNNSIHSKGAHGYGSITAAGVDTTYSWHHNLYAHHNSRNPRLGSSSGALFRFDFVNNVIYDWGNRAGYSGGTTEFAEMNYVANYLVAGPSRNYNYAFQGGGATTVIYQRDNRIDLTMNGSVDGVDSGWGMFSGTYTRTDSPFAVPALAIDAAAVAYQRVLAQAGAMPWRRDAADTRVTRTVRTLTGEIIDAVAQVGAWPTLNAEPPPADFDHDGMPDYWERAAGLDPANAADRNTIDTSGYTELEVYLNWLADPHAVCDLNGQVDVDLRAATGNATNLTYTVADGVLGTVSLFGDDHTARFTAPPNISGEAGFSFTAHDPMTAVSFGPVHVGVLVTSTNGPSSNTAPVLAPIADQTGIAGTNFSFTCHATDPDTPTQTLTFALKRGPAGATIDPGSGVFLWRPTVAQSPSSNRVTVLAVDDGAPQLSMTQSCTLTVRLPAAPAIQSTSPVGSGFMLSVSGDPGPDYTMEASTNLVDWTHLFTTNRPVLPFTWTEPDAGAYPLRFYRILLSP